MIKGIDGKLKPFLSKVILNNPKTVDLNKRDQYGYYYSSDETGNTEMLVTTHFSIKSALNSGTNTRTLGGISNSLENASFNLIFIYDKNEFFTFSTLEKEEKVNLLRASGESLLRKKLVFSKSNVGKYISRLGGVKTLNVPLDMTTKISYFKNKETENNKNPNFLGCVYFLSMGNSILEDTINMEIMFNAGLIFDRTGYFVIGDSYGYDGQEFTFTKVEKEISDETRLLSVFPGMTNAITGETEEAVNRKANEIFGSPGDVWAGAVHFHKITDTANPNFGKSRAMAGASHNNMIPHPYLFYVSKPNKKIVDFRSLEIFEDLFSYKSNDYERILATSKEVVYTGQKSNLPVDNLIKNKPILSEGKFSIRPVTKSSSGGVEKTKDNVSFFFAIDKKSLLVETTKLSDLLQKLTAVDEELFYRLTENLSIIHFEIIRNNKETGESKSLLVGNNDSFFDDSRSLNNLGKNISKGFSLTNKTNEIFIENSGPNDFISFYEFVDGDLDATKDNGKYSYEVKLKFRDPMREYLSNRLSQMQTIIQNLDELSQKVGFMMKDSNTGRMVSVFDKYQGILNETFVSQALMSEGSAVLPMSFEFNAEEEVPTSIANAFTNASNLSNLNLFFIALNTLFSESFNSSSSQLFLLGLNSKNHFTRTIKSALRLSSTTPLLLEKITSLVKKAEAKTRKLADIYSVRNTAKKSTGFTPLDLFKSEDVSSRDVSLIEFDYKFDNVLDLRKRKNNFNWIEEARNYSTNGGIKEISTDAYKSIVQNPNIVDFLTNEGRLQFLRESNFDYSFLPYASPSSLSLQESGDINVYLDYLQTIRKKIFDNMKDADDSVLIPEILSNFGVRIIPPKGNQEAYIATGNAYTNKTLPVNNGFEDNFGTSYTSKTSSDDISFGSTEKEDFAWQGASYKKYPINFSLAFMNLLLTNSFNRRNINTLNKERQNLSEDISLPFSVNLFSSSEMSDLNSAKTFMTDVIENIFDTNGNLKFDNYHYYSYLLGVFSRVYYLRGFELNTSSPFNYGDLSISVKALPTTLANEKFIKKMNWEPLSLEALENIPQGKKLLCKAVFFEGDAENHMVDKKVVNLYKDYSNYNQLFYINRNNQTPVADPTTLFNANVRTPAREVETESLATVTREQLNKEVRGLNTLIEDINKEAQRESTKEEDIALKESLARQRNVVKVIRKRE